LVICLTVVLKLAITVFLVHIFRHSDRNDLVISKMFQSMAEKKNSCRHGCRKGGM